MVTEPDYPDFANDDERTFVNALLNRGYDAQLSDASDWDTRSDVIILVPTYELNRDLVELAVEYNIDLNTDVKTERRVANDNNLLFSFVHEER